jgi:hypothetical protein
LGGAKVNFDFSFDEQMTTTAAMRKRITDVTYSFPFQLLVLHLRSNLLLIGTWIFLALVLTGNFGQKFGLRYLFLSPEYMGKVGFWSFFYVGIGFGALVMSWNLTTYLLSAYRFSFLASLARPFTKFAFNNSLIPLAFTLLFLVTQIKFGLYYELRQPLEVLWNSVGFLSGFATLVLAIALYFYFTNKDIFSLLKGSDGASLEGNIAPGREDNPVIQDIKLNRNQWRVDTYLTESLRPRIVRSVAHYDSQLLLRVFRQNHLNALIVQLFTLIVLILLGALMDRPACRIPTGASIFLLSSMLVAIAGAISYWFNKWRVTALIVLFILINQLTRFDLFHHKNKAYGLDYRAPAAAYHPDSLQAVCNKTKVEADRTVMLSILEKWRQKVLHFSPRALPVKSIVNQVEKKPKMVFFCVSGGGLKSAAWAMQVLQHADSLTGGRFLEHTMLMSGASGGLMGTTYFRELALRKKQGESIGLYDRQHIFDVSKDLLNPISFTIVTNDLFLPWATFEQGGFRYKKDRGYIFEKTLNENTYSRLDKTIGDYTAPEREALIPLVFITPSIVNDGRRMVISSQPVTYMMVEPAGVEVPHALQVDAVDFGWLFEKQGAQNLRFTTALRMNATYPYVLPNVYLPSDPPVEVLDAGFRDNFGVKSATRFIHVFKDWIKENTGGVVMVIVRAFERERKIETSENRGVFETLLNPLGIAFKVMSLQDYEHDNNLGLIYDILGKDCFEIIRFTYHPSEELKDSPISFYLTERERKDVLRAIGSEESRQSLKVVVEALAE